MTFVGIDVSKLSLDVAALLDTGEIHQGKFGNTPEGHHELLTWLEFFPNCRMALEATGSYHRRLAATLRGTYVSVSILNPAQVSYFVKSQHRRNKTDKADALWVAVYVKERQPAPTLAVSPLRQLLAREIQALAKDLTRPKNRLEAAEHGQVHPEVVTSLKRRIASLAVEKETLENELELETRRSNEHELSLLTSIPGIGIRTACLLLAELGSVQRFATARKLVAFVGLTPTQFTSGTSVAQPSHISRLGSAYLRHILYMPCLAAIRFNPVIKDFFERLVRHGKHKKAAVVACMAKLLRMIFGVLTHRKPFQPTSVRA